MLELALDLVDEVCHVQAPEVWRETVAIGEALEESGCAANPQSEIRLIC